MVRFSLTIPIFLVTLDCSYNVTTVLVHSEESRSPEGHVDPWDILEDYDTKVLGAKSSRSVVDEALRRAQRDIKYFHEDAKPWERPDPGEDHIMGFNYTAWNKTYIRPPPGLGDKQTAELMHNMMVPEFDISKIKLKPDRKNNQTMIFGVLLKPGPENKIVGYSSKRLYVQIHAPSYKGAVEHELGRFLSKILSVPRKQLKIKQGAGNNIRKVFIPKAAVQEKVYVRKLLKEFSLEKVTSNYDA